jgi:hypothetical protein
MCDIGDVGYWEVPDTWANFLKNEDTVPMRMKSDKELIWHIEIK